jgi:hypothetical protein
MSFREKSAWIAVLSYLAVYGFYFRRIAQAALSGEADTFHYGSLLVATVIVLVIVQIALLVALAIAGPRDAKAPRDERDRLVELKAVRIAFIVLSCSVLTVCWFAAFNPPGFYTVNALFFALVLSEIVRNTGQITYYRSRV